MEIRPVNLMDVEKQANNVYEAVIICAKKARIINEESRLEYNALLNTMNPDGVDDEFDDKVNSDKLQISLEFEKKPKPHLQALNSFLKEGIKHRYKEENNG